MLDTGLKKRLGFVEGFIILLLIAVIILVFQMYSLSSRIDELEVRVEKTEQSVDENSSQISDLETSVEENESQINEIKEELNL